ncbi:hypothetical protein J8273_1494 [Carpediemonas membranifera]|uniref:CCHC-type domain-containing protein n=1 Tax=Carpediemonas membranifera TaxID=201153 RepID=A0A8J6E5Z2_9EUKA|nr:hypothetical protein J8273_1494 [Carpediemonas membranifera]|eukprot:KAG9396502.1 hypothetical protein J8273_1494 [Carpediemonas membranifera]
MPTEEEFKELKDLLEATVEENKIIRARMEGIEEDEHMEERAPKNLESVKKEFTAWINFFAEYRKKITDLPDEASFEEIVAIVRSLVEKRLEYLRVVDAYDERTARNFLVEAEDSTTRRDLMRAAMKAARDSLGARIRGHGPKRVGQPRHKCGFCGKTGHPEERCWRKHPEIKR